MISEGFLGTIFSDKPPIFDRKWSQSNAGVDDVQARRSTRWCYAMRLRTGKKKHEFTLKVDPYYSLDGAWKKKQSVISNCLTHYNASYNPNYYPKSQSFPICYTFWSLPLPQSMRIRRVRFFFTVLSCHGDSTGGWSRLSWCFFF